MRVVSGVVMRKHISLRGAVLCLQFFVQVLGIMQLGAEKRMRLYVFIFGGEDAVMQADDIERMHAWKALLARQIYREMPAHHFLAVLLSFSDNDIQSLVLNEKHDTRDGRFLTDENLVSQIRSDSRSKSGWVRSQMSRESDSSKPPQVRIMRKEASREQDV